MSCSLVESDQKLNHIDENGETHEGTEFVDSRDQSHPEVRPSLYSCMYRAIFNLDGVVCKFSSVCHSSTLCQLLFG